MQITIPTPTLTAGEYFSVRYRQQGTTNWTGPISPNPTNAPFNLPLVGGIWEVEAAVFTSGKLCPAVIFTVDATVCNCPTILSTVIYKPNTSQYAVEIKYTEAATPAPCGMIIEYGPPGQVPRISHVPPGNPLTLNLSVPGPQMEISIYADCCVGKERKLCYTSLLTYKDDPPPPACVRLLLGVNFTIGVEKSPSGQWRIKIVLLKFPPDAQAPTKCEGWALTYRELVCNDNTGAGDSASYNVAPINFNATTTITNDTAYFPINPRGFKETGCTYFRYDGSITDCCGGVVGFGGTTSY